MASLWLNGPAKALRSIRVLIAGWVRRGKHEGVCATSIDLCDSPSLRTVLGGVSPVFHSRLLPSRQGTIFGWGRKWSGKRAVTIAGTAGVPFVLLEDGFLRSAGRQDATLSLVFDDRGIYYDAISPSQIEAHIAAPLTPDEEARARRVMRCWRAQRVSKYNDAPEYAGPLPDRYVLVLDQVAGDLSVGYGKADAGSFQRMLRAALAEHPDATVIVKVHPDVHTRAKRGYFDLDSLRTMARVRIIADHCHPVRLIEQAQAVYTVTSQVGFEALIWGRPVRCFGMPFYAGWGLTQDELPPPARRHPVPLEQLVHGALIRYPRYIDPERQVRCEVEAVLDHLGLQRRMVQDAPAKVYAYGFSRWKRPVLRRFLAGPQISFVRHTRDIPADAVVAVWGNRQIDGLHPTVRLLRVEDGFLRSAGLGADLVTPLSWVIDDMGIYYDASRPSRLEHILQSGAWSPDDIARAGRLRRAITDAGISKCNLAAQPWRRPDGHDHVILVPGQVENDASLRFGAPGIRSNVALLRAVRDAHPDAFIVYKPHPDVVAGLRRAGQDEADAPALCDAIVTDADPVAMLAQVDAVHTMTSLLGFEALLREVPVTCYGQPFYAGWGLTNDILPVARRTRRLTVDELAWGALIAYPRYVSRVTQRFSTPERAVDELAAWRSTGGSQMPLWRRGMRVVLRGWAQSRPGKNG